MKCCSLVWKDIWLLVLSTLVGQAQYRRAKIWCLEYSWESHAVEEAGGFHFPNWVHKFYDTSAPISAVEELLRLERRYSDGLSMQSLLWWWNPTRNSVKSAPQKNSSATSTGSGWPSHSLTVEQKTTEHTASLINILCVITTRCNHVVHNAIYYK